MINFIENYNNEFIETLNTLNRKKIITLYNFIEDTKKKQKKVFILGNGGSSSSASHWVCDFNKGVNHKKSKRLQMYSLTDNMPLFSAIGNDFSYKDVFEEQLKNYLSPGDLIIGLSVSGNSENIIKGLEYAVERNAMTFSIIGDYEGEMKEISHESLIVNSKNYGIVEDIHMYVCHVISQYMYNEKVNF